MVEIRASVRTMMMIRAASRYLKTGFSPPESIPVSGASWKKNCDTILKQGSRSFELRSEEAKKFKVQTTYIFTDKRRLLTY